MERMLDVYLQERRVGHLIQDDGGQMSFEYVESWLAQPGATALSQSLPLRKERFKRKECTGFFGGILPEESKREIIAGNNDAHGKNFSLLYRGARTEDLEIVLSPLYDVVRTVYYPELSR